MVQQQSNQHWLDAVGGCDDCSTVQLDAALLGITRDVVMQGNKLTMRENRPAIYAPISYDNI
ncbi:hypothetical protein [Yoonia sp. SS1-5]|uniref:Uncharacterized protein n=1 Tax=Yoonia rhodophyticola TaxID=3137370 RepID=A0AAN0MDB9_9RHOB